MKQLNKICRSKRKQTGLTQDQVALGADLNVKSINQWELSKENLSVKNQRLIAGFLKVDINIVDECVENQLNKNL